MSAKSRMSPVHVNQHERQVYENGPCIEKVIVPAK